MAGGGVADSVGDVDGGSASGDGFFDDFAEEIEFGADSVFGGEFDVVAEFLRLLDGANCAFDDLGLIHFEFEFAMDGAGGEEDVDAAFLSAGQSTFGFFDVFVTAAGECADCGAVAEAGGDLRDGFEVARGGDGETGFDDIDTEFDEGAGDFQFFPRVHAAAGRLFAVAEGGVEDHDLVAGHGTAPAGLAVLGLQKNPEGGLRVYLSLADIPRNLTANAEAGR